MLGWVIAVVALIIFLWLVLIPRDADPEIIIDQGSLSTVRQPGESAVLRSHLNDHGRPLLGAALKAFKISTMWEPTVFSIEMVDETLHSAKADLPTLVGRFQATLEEIESDDTIIAALPAGIEALALVFAASFANHDLQFILPGDAANYKGILVESGPLVNGKPLKELGEVIPRTSNAMLKTDDRKYSQQDIGTAIASQIAAMGTKRWSYDDKILVFNGLPTPYCLTMMLAALSISAKLVFLQRSPTLNAFDALETIAPTAIISEDLTMRSLLDKVNEFGAKKWTQFAISKIRLKKGHLSSGLLPGFSSVTTIYSESGPDDLCWLDNSETSALRSLTGCQLLRALTIPGMELPIAQTMPGDYRDSQSLPGTNFGAPLPGVELKLVGGVQTGELYYRFNDDWSPSGLTAEFRGDGCVYVHIKRVTVSDKYFYTGER